jgi:hypothetical protein
VTSFSEHKKKRPDERNEGSSMVDLRQLASVKIVVNAYDASAKQK